jgi:chaperonin GroEL (HSP60 family)
VVNCSFLCSATTHDLWQSLATDVNDAVRVVYTSMMTTHSIVGGGGSTEVALALYLTQLADSLTVRFFEK